MYSMTYETSPFSGSVTARRLCTAVSIVRDLTTRIRRATRGGRVPLTAAGDSGPPTPSVTCSAARVLWPETGSAVAQHRSTAALCVLDCLPRSLSATLGSAVLYMASGAHGHHGDRVPRRARWVSGNEQESATIRVPCSGAWSALVSLLIMATALQTCRVRSPAAGRCGPIPVRVPLLVVQGWLNVSGSVTLR